MQMNKPHKIILHLDMNAFFASVEQAFNPELQGKPVAIVPGGDYAKSAILTCSYQAKAQGVKNFMRLDEAKRICPGLIAVSVSHHNYYEVNQRLAEILSVYTEDMEIYSIDEFFFDLTDYFKLRPHLQPRDVALEMKAAIASKIHPVLTCSIGIAGNKLLAKVGSDFKKPDGLTEISWENRFEYLDQMKLEDIWGIGRNCLPKLYRLGITSTYDIRQLSDRLLTRLVGPYSERLKLIARGEHYGNVVKAAEQKPRRSMQHAHTLAKPATTSSDIKALLHRIAERLARRLRKNQQAARDVSLAIRLSGEPAQGWGGRLFLSSQKTLTEASASGSVLYEAACELLNSLNWEDRLSEGVRYAVIGVDRLTLPGQELLLPAQISPLVKAIDQLNYKFGEFSVRSADLWQQRVGRAKKQTRGNLLFHPDYN